MSDSTGILGKAFDNALLEAATLDRQGSMPDDYDDLFAGHQPTNTELVTACLKFYNENQSVMDAAIQGALKYLDGPHGVAQVKALEGSFESAEPNPLSVTLASEIFGSSEFESTRSVGRAQGMQGFGIGVSAGASAFAGVLAGADIVFDFQNKAQVSPRTWVGGSLKSGISASAGLELSFWFDKPTTGVIAGWLIDLDTTDLLPGLFIRFMHIKEREAGAVGFTFSGVSLQLPFGLGFPLRRKKDRKTGLAATFLAKQSAWAKSKRATLDVVNKATGINTIAVEESATLTVTLKNTSGNPVTLSAGATMTIVLPTYFSDDDVANMAIDYSNWTMTTEGSKLTLTLQSDYPWKAGDSISFDITGAESSSTPPRDQQSDPGTVSLTLRDTSFSTPLVTSAEFDLVWASSAATIDWSVDMISDDFVLNGDASGTGVRAYAQPGSEVVELTTATSVSTQEVWVLGYIFNYNTAVPGKVVPQLCAVWWKQDAVKSGKNLYDGNYVSESGDTSVCNYGNISTESYISITVTFG